ncbi:hypothetical protein PoB_006465100 [Plakobranchus ocellatus]|uniref:Uncharacterized protein n=1 Tax=Plakobranchus ocellatus TaxID=259542 RepID=A0AAV4D2A9_9GAST|nr:hypothetical protein PoB_006465100 [Plakobranchus ocellatus]
MANERKRRGCFLFYVYGFFLGLGCGVISAIFAFEGSPPAADPSKCLIVIACVLSTVTFVTQLVIACRGESSAGQRSASIVVGLFITACATIGALATSPGHKGIFFMGCAFSAVLYIFTIIAFSVNFSRDRKLSREQEARAAAQRLRNASSQSEISTLAYGAFFPDSLGSDSHIYLPRIHLQGEESERNIRREGDGEGQRGQGLLPMSELLLLGIPPNIALPAYSETDLESGEIQGDPPPSYSDIPNFLPASLQSQDISSTSQQQQTGPEASQDSSHSDAPPDYFDLETHM